MIDKRFFDDLNARLADAVRNSPMQDLEKNIRALFMGWLDRLDVVTREDFELQKKLLEQAQARLAELEARVTQMEGRADSRRGG